MHIPDMTWDAARDEYLPIGEASQRWSLDVKNQKL